MADIGVERSGDDPHGNGVLCNSNTIKSLARSCGFELAGMANAGSSTDFDPFHAWVNSGFAGEMGYLTDRRAGLREDPRTLLPTVESIICAGKLYNTPQPYSTEFGDGERAWISRYAWGEDYHRILRGQLQKLVDQLRQYRGFDYKICVDTAPLLERSYARLAGLGWIGKNTCLINQQSGSWFFLGEILTSLKLEADHPPPDRCGTCTRCIDACPTAAIVPFGDRHAVDARLCISYYTIELRSGIPAAGRASMGSHIFGCDICQDVCPWNGRSPTTDEPGFDAQHFAPPLERMASLTELEFNAMFRNTPIERARYRGFLRNVAVAMGNTGSATFREPLEKLRRCADPLVAEHASWALERLR